MGEWAKKVWLWIVAALGGVALFIGIYFAGSAKRKGQVELEVAKHELDKANKQYDASVKKVAEIHEKKKKLVGEILSEQLRRAEDLKRTKGLTDAQVIEELKSRGDIDADGN